MIRWTQVSANPCDALRARLAQMYDTGRTVRLAHCSWDTCCMARLLFVGLER